MDAGIINIAPAGLFVGLIFVFIAGCASIYHTLGLEKDILVGTIRTFAQLFLLGYALKLVFEIDQAALVFLIFVLMTFFAARTIYKRVNEKQVSFFWPVFFSMVISYFFVATMVTAVIVNVSPWWTPRYFIPLSGMVIGNSMNAISLSLERMLGELRSGKKEIEMKLCHGADYKEATGSILSSAMRAGMIPSINAMMAVGLVFIPGMMTGQILSGTDPLIAIRYQIVIMVMLVGSTSIGTLIIVLFVRKMCFNKGQQLILD